MDHIPTVIGSFTVMQIFICLTNSKAGHCDHIAPLFAKHKILRFNDLYEFCLCKFMYKYINNALPSCFNACFTLASNVHSCNTRSASRKHLYVQFSRTALCRNSLVNRGISSWNKLNDTLKSLPTLPAFAKKLKMTLLNTYL